MKKLVDVLFLFLMCHNSWANSRSFFNTDKGHRGIVWGTEYSEFIKLDPPGEADKIDCQKLIHVFPKGTTFRNYIDEHNVFPGLRLSEKDETKDRDNAEINLRYRIERGIAGCSIFYDNKFVGYFYNRGSGPYQLHEEEFKGRWGYPVKIDHECEEKCNEKYRIYFYSKGDTELLSKVIPYKTIQFFVYSKSMTGQIKKTLETNSELIKIEK